MKKFITGMVSLFLVVQVLLPRNSSAQVFVQPIYGPPPKSIPNFGTPNDQAIHGNWNVESILNVLIAAYAASNTNIDLNASFNVNSISGNIATADKYGPTQNGFYLNNLAFESELAKGVTIFGQARLQDDFNKFGDFNVRDGHLKYDFQYEKLINRQITPAVWPTPYSVDVIPTFGWPDFGGGTLDAALFQFPGFNPNAFFYPRIDDFFNSGLHYAWDNGFGAFAYGNFRSQTGQQLLSLRVGDNAILEGPFGRNNNLSDITAGLDYTSPANLQFYGATTFRNWNNKQQVLGLIGAPLPGIVPGSGGLFLQPGLVTDPATGIVKQPCSTDSIVPSLFGATNVCFDFMSDVNVPNFKQEDTRWDTNQAGFRVPISTSVSFSADWKNWDKTTAGIFPTGYHDDLDLSGFFGFATATPPLILNTPDARMGITPTNLSPQVNVSQETARVDFFIDNNSMAYIHFGHWEENPNASVLHETQRFRNNATLQYLRRFGSQSITLFGAWEQETLDRTIDFREIRYWDGFNPILNNAFASQQLGTAVWNGSTVTFAPLVGVTTPAFTTQVVPPGCGGASGCGVNTITYPVYGIETIPGVGQIPVVAPLGRQTFHDNTYQAQLRVGGPIVNTLEYNVKIGRTWASNSLFRLDPQNDWKNHYELTWTPSQMLMLTPSLDTEDNHSSSAWVYPYSDHDNTFNLTATYTPASSFSLYADYRNFTQAIDMTSPVFNSFTPNFIGPPNFTLTPTVGSGFNIHDLGPAIFAQYLAQPLNNIVENVRDQDQEISAGATFNLGKDWNLGVNYTHSRPQIFQNIFLTNPAILNSAFGLFSPNTPVGFYANLPELEIMQAVDGRENSYGLNLSHRLHDGSEIGILSQYQEFRNLAPVVTAISTAPLPALAGCTGVTGINCNLNSFQFGQSLDRGHIFSTSVTYTKNF